MSDALLVAGRWVVRGALATSDDVVEDGGVLCDGGRVIAIGSANELRRRPHGREIGSSDCIVIPGLVNSHHHAGLTSWHRGVSDDALEPWLVAMQAQPPLDPELDTLLGAADMLAAGITTVQHNQLPGMLPADRPLEDAFAAVLDTYASVGMRVAGSLAYRDQHLLTYGDDRSFVDGLAPGSPARIEAERRLSRPVTDLDDHLATVEALHASHRSERCRVLLSAHNVQWCTDGALTAIRDAARRLDTGVHLHLQETSRQLAYGFDRWGCSPLAHLGELGMLGPHLSCAHGVWLADGDVELLAASGTVVCHNPSSNLRLGSGVADVAALGAAGVSLALGLDQAGLDEDQDLLREMRLALRLHRGTDVTPRGPGVRDVFAMATTGGRAATGFDGIGRLDVGGPADVVTVDLERARRPWLHPDTHPLDVVVVKARAGDVRSVVVDGRIVVDDGRMLTVDVDEVHDRVATWAATTQRPADTRDAAGAELVEHVRQWFSARRT